MRVATLWTRPADRPLHDLLPEHRRELVAVEAVEDAARLLGVDETPVELARVLDRLLDRRDGDLVEDHPLHGHPRREHLQQVPGDRLALAVLVGREVELARLVEEGAELAHLVLFLAGDDVERLEVVLDVDPEPRPRLRLVGRRDLGGRAREVADVPDRRLDQVTATEEARDRFRLGGRFDDNERLGHGEPSGTVANDNGAHPAGPAPQRRGCGLARADEL